MKRMEKNVIEALVECDYDKLISVFTGRYFQTIRDFVFGEGKSVPDKAIFILKERIESTLSWMTFDLFDNFKAETTSDTMKKYVVAAVEKDGVFRAALFDEKAFLAGERETKLRFPADKNRVFGILERCSLSDDKLTNANKYEVISDVVWEALWLIYEQ